MMSCLERARSSSGIFYSRIHERMLDCCYASYIAGGAWILKPEEYMEVGWLVRSSMAAIKFCQLCDLCLDNAPKLVASSF